MYFLSIHIEKLIVYRFFWVRISIGLRYIYHLLPQKAIKVDEFSDEPANS